MGHIVPGRNFACLTPCWFYFPCCCDLYLRNFCLALQVGMLQLRFDQIPACKDQLTKGKEVTRLSSMFTDVSHLLSPTPYCFFLFLTKRSLYLMFGEKFLWDNSLPYPWFAGFQNKSLFFPNFLSLHLSAYHAVSRMSLYSVIISVKFHEVAISGVTGPIV